MNYLESIALLLVVCVMIMLLGILLASILERISGRNIFWEERIEELKKKGLWNFP